MRSYTLLINEAELMARSPEGVYDWFNDYAARVDHFSAELDVEAENALRDRNEPLIDLALAKFTRNSETARVLFKDAQNEPLTDLAPAKFTRSSNTAELLFTHARSANQSNAHARAVRMAVLSNQVLGGGFFKIPDSVFSDGRAGVLAWLSVAEKAELFALFQNPSIDVIFLRQFLEQKDSWLALDEDRLFNAMHALIQNKRMRTEYDGDMDGSAEYTHNAVFAAAWKLAETVPTTPRWATILGHLLEGMPEGASVKNPLTIAQRWQAGADNEKAQEEEERYAKSGYLTSYQMVRSALAKADISARRGSAERFLLSDDPAFREAAYSTMRLSVEQIQAGYERDKNLAVNCCQRNDWLWMEPEKRKVLHDVSWAILEYNSHYMDSANTYNFIEEQQKLKHPAWFSESELVEQADLPPTRGDITAVIEAGDRIKDAWLEPIATALVAVNKRISMIWWFSLGALVLSAWRHL
jgi:hypothetical protein